MVCARTMAASGTPSTVTLTPERTSLHFVFLRKSVDASVTTTVPLTTN